MKKLTYILLILFLFLMILPNFIIAQEKRVAVFDFEDKTKSNYRWWHGKGAGYGMSDMLVTALVKSGKFKVYERDALDKIMQEQKLGQSGAITQQTAAKVGKLLGVQYAIIGSISEFGYSKESLGGRVKGIGVGIKKQEATVAVDIRIVNVETGEIIFSDNIRKDKSKKGLSLSTPKLNFRNRSQFDDSLVGKATREAINDVVDIMDKHIKAGELIAKVIKMDGDTRVIINKGSLAGIKMNEVLFVYRKGEELIDPDTGISLGAELEKVGTIKVVSDMVGGKASKAELVSGSNFQGGDVVKRK